MPRLGLTFSFRVPQHFVLLPGYDPWHPEPITDRQLTATIIALDGDDVRARADLSTRTYVRYRR